MAVSLQDTFADTHDYLDALKSEFQQAALHNRAVTLLFIKIIHLDQIGRSYGNHTATLLFRDIQRLVCENIRRDDRCFACGSDELMIILPNTPKAGATRIAAKLQRVVESFSFTNGKGGVVTLTPKLGIASYSYGDPMPEVVLSTHRSKPG